MSRPANREARDNDELVYTFILDRRYQLVKRFFGFFRKRCGTFPGEPTQPTGGVGRLSGAARTGQETRPTPQCDRGRLLVQAQGTCCVRVLLARAPQGRHRGAWGHAPGMPPGAWHRAGAPSHCAWGVAPGSSMAPLRGWETHRLFASRLGRGPRLLYAAPAGLLPRACRTGRWSSH